MNTKTDVDAMSSSIAAGIYHPTGSYHHSRRSVSGSSWMGPGRPYQQHHGGPDGSSSSSSIGSSSSAGGVGFSGISGALGQIRTTIPKFRWGLRAYILIGVWTASCMMWFYHAYPDTAEDLTAHIHIPDTITNHASKLTDSIGSTLGRTHKKLTSGLHVASSSSAGAAACRFNVSDHPLPVHHIPELLHYNNTPTSRHRPSHQFHDCSTPRTWNEPILTLVTVTHNPGSHFPETHNNLKAQSLHNFQWLIVDDHSDNPEALSRLRHAADTDPRIHLVKNTGPAGVTSARNFGLSAALAGLPYQSPYIAMLDDDDMFELTTIEKAVWMLESNSNWDLVSYDFVKFGHENRTDIRGLHLGSANFYGENYVANTAMFRSSAAKDCRYDDQFKSGGEDWDFWICLAENGHWGGQLPEPAYWYRVNDPTFRKSRWGDTLHGGFFELRERIKAKHNALTAEGAFPERPAKAGQFLEPSTYRMPFHNAIPDTSGKGSILVVLPWLFMGGADLGAVRQVEMLVKDGYRVTVVCTLHDAPKSIELRPWMMQWTHDVHILPTFLRPVDHPRYIKYLAETRHAKMIFFSNAMLMYGLLPSLREQLPDVAFVDYLHNEIEHWKSGGYPRYSILHQRYLDRTITCSEYLKQWMSDRGYEADRIGVVKLGVDLTKAKSITTSIQQQQLKQRLYGVSPDVSVVLSVARLDIQKRPILVPHIIKELVTKHGYTCPPADQQRKKKQKGSSPSSAKQVLMVMVGGGDLEVELAREIRSLGKDFETCFVLAGLQNDPSEYYQSADVFLLPSTYEGISVSVNEAMAAGLPIVTTHVGGLPEQVGPAGDAMPAGLLLKPDGEVFPEAPAYAGAIHQILDDPELKKTLGRNGVQRTNGADWHVTLRELFPELRKAYAAHENPRTPSQLARLPHPATDLALQNQLIEYGKHFDLLSVQQSLVPVAPRAGYGRDLQAHCSEQANEPLWFDAVSDATVCPLQTDFDGLAMQQSALYQCRSWCIWDLRTKDHVGWAFNGKCFRRFSARDKQCEQWYKQRPDKVLS